MRTRRTAAGADPRRVHDAVLRTLDGPFAVDFIQLALREAVGEIATPSILGNGAVKVPNGEP